MPTNCRVSPLQAVEVYKESETRTITGCSSISNLSPLYLWCKYIAITGVAHLAKGDCMHVQYASKSKEAFQKYFHRRREVIFLFASIIAGIPGGIPEFHILPIAS